MRKLDEGSTINKKEAVEVMKNFAIYFPNTELITEISADSWNKDKDNLLTFYQNGNGQTSQKIPVAIFNMNNILGFKEIKDNTIK